MDAKPRIEIQLRINFGPARAIGPGKIDLLERIAAEGSLARAAADLDMSYRRAWGLLRDLELAFRKPVAIRTVGGPVGGGAELTPFARRLISAYRAAERVAASAASAEFAAIVRPRRTRKRPAVRRRARKPRAHG